MAINPLKQYKILITDPDAELAKVLRDMLNEMGFSNVSLTQSGEEAYRMLGNAPFDFLITEWNTKVMDGINLLKKVRYSPDSPNPTLPVIMLTGRSEQLDVFTARDYGINEFVVKPFTAKSIYSRIERIIENPRQFVVSKNFVGPDRRSRGKPPPGVADRRVRTVQPQLQPKDVHGAMANNGAGPRIWLPDFSLKYKLGNKVQLSSLVTPSVLAQAQAAIDAISDASLQWIKDDLKELRALLASMNAQSYGASLIVDMSEASLSINSRAGTFGYSRASEIAYALYLFCRNHLNPKNKDHAMLVQKHIEVLQVILGNQMRGAAGTMGEQIALELKTLTTKFTS